MFTPCTYPIGIVLHYDDVVTTVAQHLLISPSYTPGGKASAFTVATET